MTDTILHELPAARVLGRTVSCLITNADIFDVDNIIQVNRNASVIEMDPGAKWELTSDYHLAVPFNVEVLKVGSVDGSTLFCKSGTELRQTLEADASFQAKYMAVSMEANAKFAYEANINTESMYAMVNTNATLYHANLKDNDSLMDSIDPNLIEDVGMLPVSISGLSPEDQVKFITFAEKWGTHVIVKTTYGMRYSVTVEVSTTDEEVKKSFEANVKAEYGSLVTEVSGEIGVKGSESFKKFQSVERTKVKIYGGDPAKANVLGADPLNKEHHQDWASSPCNAGYEALLHVTLESIPEVLKQHEDANVRAGAAALNDFILLTSGRSTFLREITRQTKSGGYGPSFEIISPTDAIVSLSLEPPVFNGFRSCVFFTGSGQKGWLDRNNSRVFLTGRKARVEFDLLFSASTKVVIESNNNAATAQFLSQMSKYGYSPNDPGDLHPIRYSAVFDASKDGLRKEWSHQDIGV